jgi:hypothetical protein
MVAMTVVVGSTTTIETLNRDRMQVLVAADRVDAIRVAVRRVDGRGSARMMGVGPIVPSGRAIVATTEESGIEPTPAAMPGSFSFSSGHHQSYFSGSGHDPPFLA